jgi:prepilin-type N-terminal cleavage/methylation domain-containing protein
MTSKPKSHRRAGFSLIELMISMVAGLVVIAGVWSSAGMSTRMFNEQLRRSETQTSLRSATDSLVRDIGRAGLFALRSWNDPLLLNCGGAAALSSVTPIQAVQITLDGNQNHVLTLMGNFATSYQFPAISDSIVPPFNTVDVSNTSHSFADSFMPSVGGVATYDPTAFRRTFLPDPSAPIAPGVEPGRMVSVFHLPTGMTFLRMISSVDATAVPPTITFDSTLPVGIAGGGCLNNLRYIAISPVSMHRYSIVPNTTANLGSVGTGSGTRNVLVRQELHIRTGQPIPNTTRIVCDYVRSFRLAAVLDTAPAGQPPTLVRNTNPNNTILPTDYRSLIVEIEADMQADNAAAPDDVTTARRVSARRSTRFEVFMPNMAPPQ